MEPLARVIRGWGTPPREAAVWPVRRWEVLETLPPGWIPRGAGRSYADQALAGRVADLTYAPFMLAFDERKGHLRAEAGVTVRDLLSVFLSRGWFPPVVPGTQAVTLGGALASNIHGKNHHRDGDFARWVRKVRVWFPARGTVELTPEDPEYEALAGSLGLLGVVLEVELELLAVSSSWIRMKRVRARNLDELVSRMKEADVSHRYAVAWVDGFARGTAFGRGVIFLGDHLPASDLPPGKPPFRVPSSRALPVQDLRRRVLHPALMRLHNAWYYDTRGDREALVDPLAFFFPLDGLAHWNRLYGPEGLVQIQIVVPEEHLQPLMELLFQEGPVPPYLVVLKRMGEPSRSLLGFGRPGWTLACDYPRLPGMEAFAHRVYRRVAEVGGQVYLTKDAFLTPELLRDLYGDGVETFREWKARLDPDGVLCSDFGRRVGLCA